MTLRDHTILGGAVSLVLYPFIGLEALWFLGGTVLIDIDHYLDFIYHNKLRDLSPKKMFSYHKVLQRWWKSPDFLNMEVFHTVEFLSIILAIAIIMRSGALTVLFFGLIFHIILDLIFLIRHGILNKRVHSIVGYFLKKRSMARLGLSPARLYREAVKITATEEGLRGLKGPIDITPKAERLTVDE